MDSSQSSSVIKFSDSPDAQSELQFQDFSHGDYSVATLSTSETFSDSPDLNVETQDLLGGEKKQSSSFWEFSYYQSFFDVDTDQVLHRILWSMIPIPGRATFLDRHIRPNPDLYGPFWITATLIFSTAICANIASYLGSEGQKTWSYDFHKVSLAATALYSYAFIWPFLLYGLLWYRQRTSVLTLLEVICVFGYSLAIYIPISILWVIQVAWIQWILVIVGAALSGAVLVQTFWPILKEDNKKIAAVVVCLILLLHTLLAVGFVCYFFQPSNEASPIPVVPALIQPTSAPVKQPSSSTTVATPPKKVDRSTEVLDMVKHPKFTRENTETVEGKENSSSHQTAIENDIAPADVENSPLQGNVKFLPADYVSPKIVNK